MKKETTRRFKKGEILYPDDIAYLSPDCNKYFEDLDDLGLTGNPPKYERGSVRCLKSFSYTVTIKE